MTITFFDTNVPTSDGHLSIEMLISYFTADRQPQTATELEQLVDHIVSCQDCRKSIETFCARSKDLEKAENFYGAIASRLLTKIAQIIREIDMQNDICAYLEALELQGQEEAKQQFPLLAEHLKKCQPCQSLLEETRTLLHRAEDAGLIAPLS